MKNKKLAKILATVISCLLLVGAVVGISVSATTAAPEVEYKNLAYEGAVQVVYYVNTNGVAEGNTVKLATWMAADKSDLVIKDAETFTKFVGDVEYTIFASEGIAPKKMRDTVYAQTVLYDADGNELDRGEVVEYSVYTYVKNRLNKAVTADQKSLYHALVDYGASVQKVLGYKVSKLANADLFFDYESIKDESESLNGAPTASGSTKTRTLYKAADGSWSAATSEGATEYVFTYLCASDNIINPDGTFTHQRITTILTITEAGVAIDSVDVGGTVLSVGGTMPQAIAGSGNDSLGGPTASLYPDVALKTGTTVAVFDTNMSVSYAGYFRMNIGSVRKYGFYDNLNTPIIQTSYGNLTVAGVNCSSFASCTGFNLRIVVSDDGNGGYKYVIYVNGNLVKESAFALPETILDTSKIVDRISILAASSANRDMSITLSDTTFTVYTADATVENTDPEYKVEATNKLDYAEQPTSAGGTTTAYVTVSGSTLVNATADSYDYAITYNKITYAGPVNGNYYTFGRQKLITSVKAAGSDEETTLTVGSYTYAAGSWLGERQCWNVNGSSLDGDYFESLMTTDVRKTAPEDDATLRYVWDTEMMVHPGTRTETQNIQVTYAAGTSTAFESSVNYIRRTGDVVYYVFGGTAYEVATVGEFFHLRVEIRDLMMSPGMTGSDGKAYDPVEVSLYVNGKLLATMEDQIDASSGNYDTTAPIQVRLESLRSTVDMQVTLAGTYLDIYTAPKLDYTSDVNLIGGNKTGTTYLIYDETAGTYSVGTADSYTYKIDWKTGPYGTASSSSYVWENNKVITAITDNSGATVESFTYGSTTYEVGSVIPRAPFGLTGTTFWGNGASTKFYPNATTTDEMAPIFVFETDLVIAPISGNLSGNQFNLFVEGGANGTTGLANVTFAYDGGGSGFVYVCAATAGSGIGAQTKLDVRSGASYKENIHVVIRVTENATDSTMMDISYTFTFTNAGATDATKTLFTTTVTVAKADVTRVAVTDVSTMRSVKATFKNTYCFKRVDAE